MTDWSEIVPETTPFIIVPERGQTFTQLLEQPYIPVFEDISSSAVQLTNEIFTTAAVDIPVRAILLYPDTSTDWQPVWITEGPAEILDRLRQNYQLDFAQNRYQFNGFVIEKLFISNRTFFTVSAGPYLIFSESSLGIEDMLRAHLGLIPAIELTDGQASPGSFIANTSNLDQWIEQIAQTTYRPYLLSVLNGGNPLSLKSSESLSDDAVRWQLTGAMASSDSLSTILHGISAPSVNLELDLYIPSNVAAFSIFQLPVQGTPPADEDPDEELDNYLSENTTLYRDIASTLGSEVAFSAIAESGFLSVSEYLFIRKVNNPNALRRHLDQLVEDGRIGLDTNTNTYSIRSNWLGRLFGTSMSPMTEYYLGIYGDAVITARRNGLVESVGADSERRRVIYYDTHYITIRENLPSELSSFTYIDSPRFNTYIQPWLSPQHYFTALSSNFDILTISTNREESTSDIQVDITSFQRETDNVPYREQWIFSLGNAEIVGLPQLANIGGSVRNEIIFSTDAGTVFAIAVDGTVVTQLSTGTDRPVGSPVIYDWYGNNQNVIMQAAGNKVYAWSETGNILPNFPIILPENITSPLHIMDVTRNGLAEILVATADRNFHILNSRGEPVAGWPRTTNTIITSKPLVTELGQDWSVFAFAENGLHGWNINGTRRTGFPVFINSQFNGSPVLFNGHILGAASDGNLYSVGEEHLFTDSLVTYVAGDSLITQGLNVTNNSLNTTPAVQNLMIQVDENLVREDLIRLQSSNGSIFLINTDGVLRFTQSMGQPGSDQFAPLVTDINGDGRNDVVALASLGRLYAWDLLSGERIFDLPTTGIRHPVIHDFDNDGNKELLGQARDGLRSWTIYR